MTFMKIVRLMLAIFISAGLVLAPVQAAKAMRMMPMATMVDMAAPPADQDCSCCDIAARCPMASCTMHCVQFGPASERAVPISLIGHIAFSGRIADVHHGLGWRPPTPPPRA